MSPENLSIYRRITRYGNDRDVLSAVHEYFHRYRFVLRRTPPVVDKIDYCRKILSHEYALAHRAYKDEHAYMVHAERLTKYLRRLVKEMQ